MIGQQRRQFDRWCVVERGRWIDQFLCLRSERIVDALWCMSEAVDRPALYVIEIALAGMIGQPHASALGQYERRAVGDVQEGVDVILRKFHGDTPVGWWIKETKGQVKRTGKKKPQGWPVAS